MSFEETRFPENISYSSSGGPGYRTEVVVLESGREQRVGKWTNGRHMYNINAIKTDADFDAVIDFFHAMRGRLIGFRFKDWGDWKSNGIDPTNAVTPTDQVIGTGDGSTAVFQLVKNYTVGGQTYARPITKPVNGTLRVAVDSVEKTETTHWTCDYTTGIITFTGGNEPGNTLSVTAGYEFDVPVRFDEDNLDFAHEQYLTGTMSLPLVELRV